jgi:hypothetical protein
MQSELRTLHHQSCHHNDSNGKCNKQPGTGVHTATPALRKLRQVDHKFEASLGYIMRLSQKTKTIIINK